MKDKFRITITVFFTAVYCLAIGVVNQSRTDSPVHENPTSSQEKFISDLSSKLFSPTIASESVVTNFTSNSSSPGFKSPLAGCDVIFKAIAQRFETAFSQYANFSRNFRIKHKKSDFIFPFHYFW